MAGGSITFSQEDFRSSDLSSITLTALPDPKAGVLTVGGRPLTQGAVVDASALSGLTFQSLPTPGVSTASFTFLPAFADGTSAEKETTVTLYLLDEANAPPIARNMELSTYQNIAITGYFDAVDGEGDTLTFQLTSTPARGAVELAGTAPPGSSIPPMRTRQARTPSPMWRWTRQGIPLRRPR